MLELGGVGWVVGGLEVEQRGGELSLPLIETLTQERLSLRLGMACHGVMRGEAMFPPLEVKLNSSQVGRDVRAVVRINECKKVYFLHGNLYKNQNM